MKTKQNNLKNQLTLIKLGVITRQELIDYYTSLAEHYDNNELYKLADIYWQKLKRI